MPPRKRSEVWLHFTAVDEKKAKCDLCHSVFSYQGGGTTNLKRHLDSRHPTVLPKVPNRHSTRPATVCDSPLGNITSPNSTEVTSALQSSSSGGQESREMPPPNERPPCSSQRVQQGSLLRYVTRPASISRQKRLNNELLKFIVKDFQPFSVVEDEGFINYCKALDPSYELPSRSMLTKSLLPQHYDACKAMVVNIMCEVASIAITTDTWTSINTDSYMAVTGHIVTKEWEMRSFLVDCIDVSSSRHTAEFLKDTLQECFRTHCITNKISAVVSDNAFNISGAIKLLKLEHIKCFPHTLNLIVQEGLKEIGEIQRKVKSIIEYFHRSTFANDKLKQLQAQISGTSVPLKLINDVVTRWNSTFHMFERFCQLREPIEAALALLHVQHLDMLTTAEMESLMEICKILKPFDDLTVELSADKNVTISKILILLEGVKHYLANLPTASSSAASLKRVITTKIIDRYPTPERNYIMQLATYLDPRFKGTIYSESTLKQVIDRLTRLITEMIKGESNSTEEAAEETDTVGTQNSLWDFFDSRNPAKTNTSPTALAIIELRRYSEEALIPRKDDPLKWWQNRTQIYPRLSCIAKRILAIPSSSVPSERIFSKTGYILTERRNRIKPKNLKQIVFLNANLAML